MFKIIMLIFFGFVGIMIAHASTTILPAVNGTFTETTTTTVSCNFLNSEIQDWQEDINSRQAQINSVNAQMVAAGC